MEAHSILSEVEAKGSPLHNLFKPLCLEVVVVGASLAPTWPVARATMHSEDVQKV